MFKSILENLDKKVAVVCKNLEKVLIEKEFSQPKLMQALSYITSVYSEGELVGVESKARGSIPNPTLLEQKVKSGMKSIIKITYLQNLRVVLYEEMDKLDLVEDKSLYQDYIKLAYYLEQELQIAWNFTTSPENVNWNYFRFWDIPQTNQPRLDNSDNYPYGYYVYNIHEHFNHNIAETMEKEVKSIPAIEEFSELYSKANFKGLKDNTKDLFTHD